MGERVQPLIEAAKLLSPEEREELLDGLLEIDGQFEPDASDKAEWSRRVDEMMSGREEGVEVDDAIAAARESLRSRRGQ